MRCVLIVCGYAQSLVNFRAPVIRELRALGCRVVVAAPRPIAPALLDQILGMGVEMRDFSMARASVNPLADFRSCLDLHRVVSAVKPDAILSYTAKAVIYAGLVARLQRIPRRCAWITGLGYGFTSGSGWRRRVARVALEFGYRAALGAYDVVMFQNDDDRCVFRDLGLLNVAQEVVITAGSGVDTASLTPTPLPTVPVFLMAGRLLRDKGIYEYVGAARWIKRRYPQAQFILAGDADSNPTSVSQTELAEWQGEGTLEYVGWTDGIKNVMGRCRVFVLPSYREGMPRTVLEAMAMGRPVITTDAPGCRDAVENAKTGLLVPVKEIGALAQAMERLILNPQLAEDMGRAGRERAVGKFDSLQVGVAVAGLLCGRGVH